MFSLLFFALCSLLSLVSALPVLTPVSRDVWVPTITSPGADSVWNAGGTYTVTWDTSSEPSEVTNPQGMVYLRINDATQSAPLAQAFALTDGRVDVTIPADTETSNEWVVVLFGDSGNFSPMFTIDASS